MNKLENLDDATLLALADYMVNRLAVNLYGKPGYEGVSSALRGIINARHEIEGPFHKFNETAANLWFGED